MHFENYRSTDHESSLSYWLLGSPGLCKGDLACTQAPTDVDLNMLSILISVHSEITEDARRGILTDALCNAQSKNTPDHATKPNFPLILTFASLPGRFLFVRHP